MQPNPGDPSGLVPGGSEEENLGFHGPVEPRQVSVGRLTGLSSHVGTPRSLPWPGAADGGSVPRSPRRGRPQPSSPGQGWGNTRERAKSSEAETKLSPVTHNWWNICSNFSLFFFFFPLPLRLGSSSSAKKLLYPFDSPGLQRAARLCKLVRGAASSPARGLHRSLPPPGLFLTPKNPAPCLPGGQNPINLHEQRSRGAAVLFMVALSSPRAVLEQGQRCRLSGAVYLSFRVHGIMLGHLFSLSSSQDGEV